MKEEAVIFLLFGYIILGFTGGSAGKESVCNAGGLGLIPGLGRSAGEGNGNPLQYSCLENPMDRGSWQATYSSWGHKRVRHDLVTKQQQYYLISYHNYILLLLLMPFGIS